VGDIIRKRKDGKELGWYIRWTENGRRIQRASHQTSHAMAKRMLLEIEARVARGQAGLVEPDLRPQLTVSELCARFCAEVASPRIKDLASYRKQCDSVLRRVLPYLGPLSARALTAQHLAKARDALAAKYCAGTVRTTLIPLSAALSWGVMQGLLDHNPAKGLVRPRAAPQIEWLAADEVRRLLTVAEQRARTATGTAQLSGWSLWMAASLALYTGLRRGEIFGLRWQDVDEGTQRLTISHSYDTTTKNGLCRHLRLPAALIPWLREWRSRCPKTRDGLVCPVHSRNSWGMSGGDQVMRRLVHLQRAAQCRELMRPWHALRHTFASHFIMNGGNILSLQKILGHADIKMTLLYAHLAPDFLGEEMNKVKF
jgi:integrase